MAAQVILVHFVQVRVLMGQPLFSPADIAGFFIFMLVRRNESFLKTES